MSVPFSQVSLWTDGFKNEIGKGAFGSVFSGVVMYPEGAADKQGQGRRVAVKKVNADGIMASLVIDTAKDVGGRGANPFLLAIQREINVLSSFHHDNIVRLVGYCLPPTEELRASEQKMKELCLLYELASLGGLNTVLKDDCKACELLWQYRLKIAVGVAKGFCYMHNKNKDCPAYHRDVKAANIALMADYTPKIIDCGLSKYVADSSEAGMSMQSLTGARFGTLGYMCPYYSRRAEVVYNAKCEVFSFGIVLLEILTGQLQGYKDKNGEQVMLEETLRDDGILVADDRIQWPEGFARDFLQLAGECVAPYHRRIDSMMTVMRRLVAISQLYNTTSPMEVHLLERNRDLIAQLQSLQLQHDIRIIREVEITHSCKICLDDNIPASKGVICSNRAHPHFFCGAKHNNCFGDMVSYQSNDHGNFERNSRGIVCGYCTALVPRVVSTFDVSVIGTHTNSASLATYIGAITAVERCQGVAAMEVLLLQHADEIQILVEANMVDRAERMAAAVERYRQRIINSIINIHCPHCGLAIHDFNGCFAVQHIADDDNLRQGCGLYFCGWCLAKFGTNADCHSHVKACPHNLHPGSYFGDFPDEFNRVHGQRRGLLVLQYLQDSIQDAQEREDTKKALRRELNDLGIDI